MKKLVFFIIFYLSFIPISFGAYYVATDGLDTNAGSLEYPFLTIGKALSTCSSGDKIIVRSGTYTETGIDIGSSGTKDSVELICDNGVTIDPASGTGITISGDYCCFFAPIGFAVVTPAAGETGIEVTGNYGGLGRVRVNCASSADIGFDITGNGSCLDACRCANPLTSAFKIQGDSTKLEGCITGGESGDSSIGFWITNSCDKTRLKNCGSQGHETSGYQVDSGCTNGVVENCYSGGGDGKWTDPDNAFVWSKFDYDETINKSITLTATGGVGGTGTAYNIFKVTGAVKIHNIFGVVTTATPATNSTINLEAYSSNASVDITDAAGAPDLVSRVVGTTITKESITTDPLDLAEPDDTPAIIENSNFRTPQTSIIVLADDDATTYIQMVLTSALASGEILWGIEWEPVIWGSTSFVEPI